jgi:hypothetical protein
MKPGRRINKKRRMTEFIFNNPTAGGLQDGCGCQPSGIDN